MLKNPEIKRFLFIFIPISIIFSLWAAAFNRRAGVVTAVLCLLFLLLFLLDARRRYRTMAALAEDINALLHGASGISFAHYTEGEVSLLRSELQKMTVRLLEQAELLRKEKVQLAESMADISHQLRTPLTAVNLLLSGLSDPASEDYRKSLLALRGQIRRMDWLIDVLLKLARLDAGTVQFQQEQLSLSELVSRAAEPLSILMEVKGQTLHVDASGSVVCDRNWTAEALGNILKNCTEHMQQGEITVTASENAVASVICVRDTGKGIRPEDLPHLFERYYRGADSSEQSVGIGLALSRSIVAAQNGTLTAGNYAGGAEFTIKLYKSTV